MNYRKFLIAALLVMSFAVQAKDITVTRLTGEMRDGRVTTSDTPRLGWQMSSPENGTRQTAYEIEIRDVWAGKVVWNSGKVKSAQSQLVSCADAVLEKDRHYTWRVRVWDEADTPSAWSAPSDFSILTSEAAFAGSEWIGAITRKDARIPEGRKYHGSELKKPEAKAAWDAVDTLAKKSIYLRREFHVAKKVKDATAYVCGLGFYEFSLNGEKVGDSEFAPLWSDYDKSVYYNTYDVTSQVKKGGNAIGVLLGNGFYNVQGGRYRKLQISFGAPTLRFRMVVNYEDGTSETIVSGKDWKYRRGKSLFTSCLNNGHKLICDLCTANNDWKYDFSPVLFNCIYGGEDYDARREQKGWNMFGFKEQDWRPVVIQEAPKGVLRPQIAQPVKIMERYDIRKVTKLTAEQITAACKSTKRTVDPSAFVLDMGQNLAGFPEITVRGKKGQKITLLVSESLTDEGACNQRQTGRQHYYEYILKGEGVETWHPRFSYYGFRYIQVEGAVLKGQKNPFRLPVIQKIQSCFVYNSAPKISTFECSNRIFNDAHRLIEKAVRSNMQSVFTDCPHREKLGWLEQDHLCGPGLLYNYDLTGFVPQTLQNIADARGSYHCSGICGVRGPRYGCFCRISRMGMYLCGIAFHVL